MPRMIYDYTKSTLEKVSVDPIRFERELNKAKRYLHDDEIESLIKWLSSFASDNCNLKMMIINKFRKKI